MYLLQGLNMHVHPSHQDLEDYAKTQASCPEYRLGFKEGKGSM